MCVCVEEGRDKENERAEKRGASRKEHESQKILIKIKKKKEKKVVVEAAEDQLGSSTATLAASVFNCRRNI